MVPGNNNFMQALWIIIISHTHVEAKKYIINICIILVINPIIIINYIDNTDYDNNLKEC